MYRLMNNYFRLCLFHAYFISLKKILLFESNVCCPFLDAEFDDDYERRGKGIVELRSHQCEATSKYDIIALFFFWYEFFHFLLKNLLVSCER